MCVCVCVGAGTSATPASTVPMGASDLLTPVSAGLEGLSLGTKSSSTSFQVRADAGSKETDVETLNMCVLPEGALRVWDCPMCNS